MEVDVKQDPVFICSFAQLDDPGSYGFSVMLGDEQVEGFVVRSD